ncbi:retrovirus-related pol polyprotein from transposon TNT 1-94 [Tanacetum coccineum]
MPLTKGKGMGIFHQKSVPRTPQQNGVVKRRNHTLVEAARTMLIFSKAPMFLWAEVVATALFGALCYPTNDSEDLGKFQAKADIGIFVGYAPSRKGYRIYNKRTRRLMETIHVTFDEMHQTMAPVRISLGPEPFMMTPGQLNSGLAPSHVLATTNIPPTDKDLEILFQPMFDEYFEQSTDSEPVPMATIVNAPIVSTNTSVSTTITQDAPSTSHSLSSSQVHPPVFVKVLQLDQLSKTPQLLKLTSIPQLTLWMSKLLLEWCSSKKKSLSQSARRIEDRIILLTFILHADEICGRQDSRRSTSGSAQFLGDRLVSWSSKKQRSTAISTTEAKYIAMSGCWAQILWMKI